MNLYQIIRNDRLLVVYLKIVSHNDNTNSIGIISPSHIIKKS